MICETSHLSGFSALALGDQILLGLSNVWTLKTNCCSPVSWLMIQCRSAPVRASTAYAVAASFMKRVVSGLR